MDDLTVRSRYPRHRVPANRRSRYGKGRTNLAILILRQLMVCIIVLFIIFIVKSINSPVTNYISDKIHFVLKQNIELNNIFNSISSVLNKVNDGNLLKGKTDNRMDEEKAISTDITIVDNNENSTVSETSVLSATTEEVTNHLPAMLAPTKGILSSPFGTRVDPVSNMVKQHEGIDIDGGKGADIIAVMDGTVLETGNSKSYGKYIKIQHEESYMTVYAHCSVISVVQGQKIKQGELVAKIGNTGTSVGAHLHFEVWKDGKPVDPLEYIRVPVS